MDNWLQLKMLAPDLPWVPVLQGWTMGEYLDHAELYDKADPSWRESLVGAGSVCRRQSTVGAGALIEILFQEGIRIHAFGLDGQQLLQRVLIVHADLGRVEWSGNIEHIKQTCALALG